MIDHYNAFISYRHAPEDIKVAEAVQRGLERFHIPHKIRKQTGMKRIQQIFRDKDELPITSNLTDTISHALYNSDYLIVICSTNTKESIWVQREIEFFLRNHTKNQILTVLVNGEPQDVIPDVLKYEERTVIDNNGMYQTVQTPIEPLSCDYRMPFRKAKKVELPRLASALIGCSYDELMNRRRQYVMQRMGLIFSAITLAAGGFGVYMYQSRNQIKTNYLNSLRNQSIFLANESLHLLEDQERVLAVQLALEALPKDENDQRPVTPEAERAITDATFSYVTSTPSNIFPEWVYSLPDHITAFEVAQNGKYLAAYDQAGNIGVWNTETNLSILSDFSSNRKSSGTEDLTFISSEELIFWGDTSINCLDCNNGTIKWTYTAETDNFYDDALLGSDSEYIYMKSGSKDTVVKLNRANGTLTETINIPLAKDGKEPEFNAFIRSGIMSPNCKKIAYILSPNYNESILCVYDLETQKIIYGEPTEEYISSLYWFDDDNLLTSTVIGVYDTSMSFSGIEFVSKDTTHIQCYSPADLKEKWNTDFTCTDTSIRSGFFRFDKTVSNDTILYYSGNVATTYNIKTGETIRNYNTNDSIVNVSDFNKDGKPTFITTSGNYAAPTDENTLALIPYFSGDLVQAEYTSSIYTMKSGNEILCYGFNVYDDEWKEIDYGTVITECSDYSLSDTALGVFHYDDDGKLYLTTYDLTDFETAQTMLIDEDPYCVSRYSIVHSDRNNIYILKGSMNGIELLTVEIKTGKISTDKLSEATLTSAPKSCTVNGYLVFANAPTYEQAYITVYDIKNKISKDYPLPEGVSQYATSAPKFYPEQNTILYSLENFVYFINTETGNVVSAEIEDDWESAMLISDNSIDGKYLLSDGKRTIMIDSAGKELFSLNSAGYTANGISFYDDGDPKTDDQILIAFSNGILYRYSITDGHFLGKCEALLSTTQSQETHFEFDNENHLLYFTSMQTLCVINTESWVEVAPITYCVGHHKPTDRFITYSRENTKSYRMGYFEHYTTEHLIEKGRDFLHGEELSDDYKSQYGITDDD
ncbi:MAG: toll/interleukin-1 receptor domain-containing protein [Eubacterium sp.]|nr:toll/interleukin-1 receptor domain-containing protein [Eubacterium sp.]